MALAWPCEGIGLCMEICNVKNGVVVGFLTSRASKFVKDVVIGIVIGQTDVEPQRTICV